MTVPSIGNKSGEVNVQIANADFIMAAIGSI